MAAGEELTTNGTPEAGVHSGETPSEGHPGGQTPASGTPPEPAAPVTNLRSLIWKLLAALGGGLLGFFALSLISHQMSVVEVFKSINAAYILAALVLIFLEIVVQALRLQAIAQSVGLRVRFGTAMRNILVGEFFARVTPFAAGGGEPAQIYMLFKDDSINVADSTMVFAIKALLSGASQVVTDRKSVV